MTIAPKILVADDDQALSRTLSWILKENGYEVLTVPGGEHLFDHLSAEQFDLLLLDIMMPKVDGLQLLQRVKADPRFKDLPVLMISSMPPEEATVRSLGLGAADFIPKPFRVRELLARVKAHLRVGRELNQARAEARSRSEMMEILQEVTASLKPEEIYQILVRRVATHDFGETGHPVRVTISIGIASFPDERVSDGESLLRLADTHLYRAKTDGRNRFRD